MPPTTFWMDGRLKGAFVKQGSAGSMYRLKPYSPIHWYYFSGVAPPWLLQL